MTTSGDGMAAGLTPQHERWSALLLPLLAADSYSLFHSRPTWLPVLLASVMVVLIPRLTAKLVPFALFAYAAYGIFLAHALIVRDVPAAGPAQQVSYGLVRVGPAGSAAYVLPQAIVIFAVAAWLLPRGPYPGTW
jgi:hypothetical protein